jgi:rod shape-determining protein MreC
VQRNRSARVAALGSPVRRAAAPSYSSRTTGPLRRRLVVGLLVLASLTMITVYFREAPSGGMHDFQSAGASALRPFEIAANRIARPFTDAYNWTADLFHARSENEKLRSEVDRLSQLAIDRARLAQENAELRDALKYKRQLTYPEDFSKTAVTATVISNPASEFDQTIVISAGSSSGIRVYDAVVTSRGLVGQVTKVLHNEARVTLLTDKESAVTAKDHQTGAIGVVRHSQGPEDLLFLDRVHKDKRVNIDDLIVTAGRQQGPLSSFYPAQIPIGTITKVGQTDIDSFQNVQIVPRVDFTSLNVVLVLVSDKPRPRMP